MSDRSRSRRRQRGKWTLSQNDERHRWRQAGAGRGDLVRVIGWDEEPTDSYLALVDLRDLTPGVYRRRDLRRALSCSRGVAPHVVRRLLTSLEGIGLRSLGGGLVQVDVGRWRDRIYELKRGDILVEGNDLGLERVSRTTIPAW